MKFRLAMYQTVGQDYFNCHYIDVTKDYDDWDCETHNYYTRDNKVRVTEYVEVDLPDRKHGAVVEESLSILKNKENNLRADFSESITRIERMRDELLCLEAPNEEAK